MQYLGETLKNDEMVSVHFQGKPFSMTVIQVYASDTDARKAKVDWFYVDLKNLLELTPKKKKCLFHHWGLECKTRKSRDNWSKRQVWPWSTK